MNPSTTVRAMIEMLDSFETTSGTRYLWVLGIRLRHVLSVTYLIPEVQVLPGFRLFESIHLLLRLGPTHLFPRHPFDLLWIAAQCQRFCFETFVLRLDDLDLLFEIGSLLAE